MSLSHSHFDIFPFSKSNRAFFAPTGNPPTIPDRNAEIPEAFILKSRSNPDDRILLFSNSKECEAKSENTINGNTVGRITFTENFSPLSTWREIESDAKTDRKINIKNTKIDFVIINALLFL